MAGRMFSLILKLGKSAPKCLFFLVSTFACLDEPELNHVSKVQFRTLKIERGTAILVKSWPLGRPSLYGVQYVRIYMHAASMLFSSSMELLAFASRLLAPKMFGNLLHLSFQFVLPRYAKRLVIRRTVDTSIPLRPRRYTNRAPVCMLFLIIVYVLLYRYLYLQRS